MSELLSQLQNNIMYQLHTATYNPDAEQFAAQKKQQAEEALKLKNETKDISGADISGAKVGDADISGVMCFGTSVKLGPTNFFKADIFDAYLKDFAKNPSKLKNASFATLDAAKSVVQKRTDVTGLLEVGSGVYFYTADPTLTNTIDPIYVDTLVIANNKPTFIPVMSCDAMAQLEERKTFSVGRMFKNAISTTTRIVLIFLLLSFAILGSSLATNINVYRDFPYRVLYALYGFFFFFAVIPYVLGYRWLYLKKRPRFYSLIPLIDTPIQNSFLANLLSWLTFEPDDEMQFLDGCRF